MPTKSKVKKKSDNRISHTKKPDKLNMHEWQLELRKQFGSENIFQVTNLSQEAVFSDYDVFNPKTKNRYKVVIGSSDRTFNFCTCQDFKTNLLGTCKHIEYVIYKIKKYKPYNEIFKNGAQTHFSYLYVYYGEKREIKAKISNEKMALYHNWLKKYFDDNFTLKIESIDKIDLLLHEANSLDSNFICMEDSSSLIATYRDQIKRKERVNKFIEEEKGLIAFDSLLKVKLLTYQAEGVQKILHAGKALLADEMGLGKTIQAIAAAEYLIKKMNITKVLIVCPTSLKYQWKSEIEKFTDTSVKVIEGNPLLRAESYLDETKTYKIVSYFSAANDLDTILKYEPEIVIFDEAQRIKNWQTKLAAKMKRINTKYSFVITGTPLENKLEELYSVMQLIDIYKLGPLYLYLNQHQILNESGKVVGYKELNTIGEKLKDVMIRRKKKDVMSQLPLRSDKNLFISMTEEQMNCHEEYRAAVSRIVNKWKRYKYLDEEDRLRLLSFLNLMRMSCDSTYLIDQETRHDTKIEELMFILEEFLAEPENKVVIFSQWERMTRLVAQDLQSKGIKFEYLHGGVPSKAREKLLTNFANDPESRIFLSTDTGSVGLNLQNASMLINLDLPWNPALLEQRIARIYRMGQKNSVQIINMISQGTIEHQMLSVLKFKNEMALGVLDQGDDSIFMSDTKFDTFMQTVEQVSAVEVEIDDFTEEIIAKQEIPFNKDFSEIDEVKEIPFAKEPKIGKQLSFFGDDDVVLEEKTETLPKPIFQEKSYSKSESPSLDDIQLLTQFLSDSNQTQKLIDSLLEVDAESGRTYLKNPIQAKEIIGNVFQMFAQIGKAVSH